LNKIVHEAEEKRTECDPPLLSVGYWLVADLVRLKATGMEINFTFKDFEKISGRPSETFEDYHLSS
jgi:hypothetical protein